MRALFLIIICAVSALSAFSQNELTPAPPGGIDEVYLAKDDGNGKAGEVVSVFGPSDIPIYCIVRLSSPKEATVKMNLVAVKVNGVKPESKVVTVSYTTNGKQNQVSFTGRPDKNWTPGTYRVDVFLDGTLTKSENFSVAGAAKAPATTGNSFQAKPAVKPRAISRKPRKN